MSGPSVSVEEMASAIEKVLADSYRIPFGEGDNLRTARDYILAAEKEIAEMRGVTGPKCPKCGRWLKAEHVMSADGHRDGRYVMERGVCQRDGKFTMCFTVAELLSDYPEIAAEMGIAQPARKESSS